MNEEIKNIISAAKSICLIPAQNTGPEPFDSAQGEFATAALALFYTLKESGKNVNLLADQFPEKLDFLVPSVDALTTPKNVVISVPREAADISQIYYEKNEGQLKIHLTVERGRLKQENILFYFEELKPDLVITLGIQNFQEALVGKLDSFGYLLDVPILNIDNNLANLKFGAYNIIEEKSLAEITLDITAAPGKNAANCLLASLMLHYQNFNNKLVPSEVFNLVAKLITQGADYGTMVERLMR